MTDENEIVTNEGEETGLMAPADIGPGLTFAPSPADLDALDDAPVGTSIEPKYYEFTQVGEKLRGLYCGMSFITKKTEDDEGKHYVRIPAAVIQSKDGVYLQAGQSLVDQFARLAAGTAVQIEYKGEVPTSGGRKVKKYDIRLLQARIHTAVMAPALKPAAPPAPSPAPAQADPDEGPQDITIENVHGIWATERAAKAWGKSKQDAAIDIWEAGFDKDFTMSHEDFIAWLADAHKVPPTS